MGIGARARGSQAEAEAWVASQGLGRPGLVSRPASMTQRGKNSASSVFYHNSRCSNVLELKKLCVEMKLSPSRCVSSLPSSFGCRP